MPRYEITVLKHIVYELLRDVTTMDPFPVEVRERMSLNKDLTITQISTISITLTEEEFLFLKLKYSMVDSKELTAVDVVGEIINV